MVMLSLVSSLTALVGIWEKLLNRETEEVKLAVIISFF